MKKVILFVLVLFIASCSETKNADVVNDSTNHNIDTIIVDSTTKCQTDK